MKPTKRKSNLKEAFDNLGYLTEWNLNLVSEKVLDRDELQNVEVKKVGGTVGRITIDSEGQHWLLKKSGRTQIDDKALEEDEDPEIEKSRDMTVERLREGIAESFNERCAAQLFDSIKQIPGYLPQFALVKSTFDSENPEKRSYNRFKKDALKVYVASKIIGNDPNAINDEDSSRSSHNIHLLDRNRPSNPEILETVIDDVCENAVIMFLLSNYDVKIDNFVNPQDYPEWMVPIDFGHARHDEKSSADIFDGIDLIRRARTGMTKVLSDTFSSQPMYSSLVKSKDYIGTQTFYYKNLKPRHFLKVIEAIKSDPDIEEKLRKAAYELTFGEPKEKEEYADIITTRVRNLVKLEEVIKTIDETTFPEKNLRDIVANSAEFEDNLKNTNHSKGKEFYRLISEVFEKVESDCQSIIKMLDEYAETESIEEKDKINTKVIDRVHEFNAYAREESGHIESSLEDLENFYRDSEYLKIESSRKDSWSNYKNNIQSKIDHLFGMLLSPLEEEEENESELESESESEEEDSLIFESDSEEENEGSSVSEISSEPEENVVIERQSSFSLRRSISEDSPDWDLNKCDGYKSSLESLLKQASSWQTQIKKHTKILMTHLMAYDELQQVRQDYLEQRTTTLEENEKSLQTLIEEEKKSAKKTSKPNANFTPRDSQKFSSAVVEDEKLNSK